MVPNEYRKRRPPVRHATPVAHHPVLSGKIYVKIMPADSSTMSRSNGRSGRIVIENTKKELTKKIVSKENTIAPLCGPWFWWRAYISALTIAIGDSDAQCRPRCRVHRTGWGNCITGLHKPLGTVRKLICNKCDLCDVPQLIYSSFGRYIAFSTSAPSGVFRKDFSPSGPQKKILLKIKHRWAPFSFESNDTKHENRSSRSSLF